MKKSTFLSCLLLVLAVVGSAQTQFWSDTFEDGVILSSGTRTAENNSGVTNVPYTSYFIRTNSGQLPENVIKIDRLIAVEFSLTSEIEGKPYA